MNAEKGTVVFSDVHHHCRRSDDPLENLANAATYLLREMAPDLKYPLGYIRVLESKVPRKKRWLKFKKRPIEELKKLQRRLNFPAIVEVDKEKGPTAFSWMSTTTEESQPVKNHSESNVLQPKGTLSPPELPDELRSRIRDMGGSDIKFLMQKQLLTSDVIRNNNRLSLPASKICSEDFLVEAEMKALTERKREGNTGKLKGIQVLVLDPSMREHSLCLKRWEMNTSVTYNLTGSWYQLVTMNNLNKGRQLKVWSFRNLKSQLCFAVV